MKATARFVAHFGSSGSGRLGDRGLLAPASSGDADATHAPSAAPLLPLTGPGTVPGSAGSATRLATSDSSPSFDTGRPAELPGTARPTSRRRPLAVPATPRVLIATALALGAFLTLAASPALAAEHPTLTIDPVAANTITTAHVSGTVFVPTGGNETYWGFVTSTDGVNWGILPEGGPLMPGSGLTNVSTVLTGLVANTTYEVRVAAFNYEEGIEEFSPETRTFTTDPAPTAPVATLEPAESAYSTATLSGSVDPEGGNLEAPGEALRIHWAFQTSETGEPETWASVSEGDITGAEAEGSDPIPLSFELTGLTGGVTTHFRLLLTYGGQQVIAGPDSFETLPVTKPTVSFGGPGSITLITDSSAHLLGTVNPNAPPGPLTPPAEAAYETTYSYSCSPACPGLAGGTVPAGSAAVPAPEDATGLEPNLPYTVTLTATNSGGSVQASEDFRTDTAAPEVQTDEVHGYVTDASAGLIGALNPHNAPSSYHFEYGSQGPCDASPCQSTPTQILGNNEVDRIVVSATEGQFRLSFEGQSTIDIPYNATPEALQSALEALSTIGASNVTVVGGPGDAKGSRPYRVTFVGDLGLSDQPEILAEAGTTPIDGEVRPETAVPGGNSNKLETIIAEAKGLAPSSTYHYRLVAENGTGGEVVGADRTLSTKPTPAPGGKCPNEAIRQEQEATRLPECMAYELISPPETYGTDAGGGTALPDGNHVVISTVLPAAPGQSTGNFTLLAQVRTASGWVTHDLAAGGPRDNNGYNSLWFSEDGSRYFLFSCDFSLIGCPGSVALDLAGLDGSFAPLLTIPHDGFAGYLPQFPGASADLSTLVFTQDPAQEHLDPNDTHTQGLGLYALHDDGSLEYLATDANGEALPCGGVLANGGDPSSPGTGFQQNGVSADGDSIAYTSPGREQLGAEGCPSVADIYLRQDGHSTDVSAPRPGEPDFGDANPDEGAEFAGATRDGRYVFFTTATRLAASDHDSAIDLYRYDSKSDTVEALTSNAAVEDLSVSPGGDYVYFTAANPIGGQGVPGEENFYSWHQGQISYILTLHGAVGFGQPIGRPVGTAAVTPDGRQVIFTSTDPVLTHQPQGVEVDGRTRLFTQILRYNVTEDSITCVSCPPDGTPGPSDTSFPSVARATSTRFQSDDGDTVAFQTLAPLDPADTNAGNDTYVWHDGRVSLISDGRAASSPSIKAIGLSADGRSVFFSSFAKLTPAVRQTNLKVYVARVDGGFPLEAKPTPCTAENCRGPLSTSPPLPSSASTTFSGPPDPKPTRKKPKRGHRKKHHRRHVSHAKHHKGGHQ